MYRPSLSLSANLFISAAIFGTSWAYAQQVSPSPRAAKPLNAAEERALKPKDSFKKCEVCPEMVVVPAGSFMMGSPKTEVGRFSNEGPQRKVTIAKAFAVGKFEITFAEWDACVADDGCKHNPGDQGWGRGSSAASSISHASPICFVV